MATLGKRIRKAIVGGFAAGVSGVVGTLTISGAPTKDDVSKAIGVFIVAGAAGAYAVWRTPNATTDKTKIESDAWESRKLR